MLASLLLAGFCLPLPAADLASITLTVQPKMVKIYGAGGLKGLEAYQSGFLVSADGHILTVWSYVLDTDYVTAILDDGRRFQAELVGADPRLEIAILKIDAEGLDFFDRANAVELETGSRVLAFSNLYGVATGDEPTSLLHGVVSARTTLNARRGVFKTPYRGPVYVLDAITNNPGAAGGALTDQRGRLAGMLGKELRNSQTNTWLNYSIPITELNLAIDDILAGKSRPRTDDDSAIRPDRPHTLASLGLVMVPDVLVKTPPFIDAIRRESIAEKAGLRPDDLVLFVGDRIIPSCEALRNELSFIDRIDEVRLVIQRGDELLDLVLSAP
jgi:serine protease Do